MNWWNRSARPTSNNIWFLRTRTIPTSGTGAVIAAKADHRQSETMRLPTFLLVASSLFAATPVNVAGTWNVTVRMPGGAVKEQWTIQQKGTAVTGTAKGDHGELP